MDIESFVKMDIFFFVTTTVVTLVGILAIIFFYYLVRIVRDIHSITTMVNKEAKEIADDIKKGVHEVREGVETAKTYGKAVAGAGIVQGVASLLDAFTEEKEESKKRTTRRKAKKKVTND